MADSTTYLLSHLVKCGCCGGGFSKISRDHYGCSNARNRGTCENMLTIRRDVLEESVLSYQRPLSVTHGVPSVGFH